MLGYHPALPRDGRQAVEEGGGGEQAGSTLTPSNNAPGKSWGLDLLLGLCGDQVSSSHPLGSLDPLGAMRIPSFGICFRACSLRDGAAWLPARVLQVDSGLHANFQVR